MDAHSFAHAHKWKVALRVICHLVLVEDVGPKLAEAHSTFSQGLSHPQTPAHMGTRKTANWLEGVQRHNRLLKRWRPDCLYVVLVQTIIVFIVIIYTLHAIAIGSHHSLTTMLCIRLVRTYIVAIVLQTFSVSYNI